ncbi:hypothetical protein RB213_011089 [Colletotrichum asianum]
MNRSRCDAVGVGRCRDQLPARPSGAATSPGLGDADTSASPILCDATRSSYLFSVVLRVKTARKNVSPSGAVIANVKRRLPMPASPNRLPTPIEPTCKDSTTHTESCYSVAINLFSLSSYYSSHQVVQPSDVRI